VITSGGSDQRKTESELRLKILMKVRINKMKFCELTISEKRELKETLWQESLYHDGYTDYDYLSDDQKNVVDACSDWDDIPDDILESAYDMYDFTPEDFFCNTEDQCCDRLGNPYESEEN
jgi:hypothetical protein